MSRVTSEYKVTSSSPIIFTGMTTESTPQHRSAYSIRAVITPMLAHLFDTGQPGHSVDGSLVITTSDKPVGRKKIVTPPPVKVVAEKYKISVLQSEKISDLKSEILDLKPDLIIVAAYNQKLSKDILNIPRYGCLNVHPSLLPRWRGPSPIQFAILEGDNETGVTIIKIIEEIDAGPIIKKEELKIDPKEIYQNLHDKLAKMGADLIAKVIPKWIEGEIKPDPQDNREKRQIAQLLKAFL